MKAYLEIEMPKNCNGCPLHFYEGQGICSCCVLPAIEDDEILKPWKNKRKDCPLVTVPPHGDLIDRREAIIDANERAYDFWLSDDEVNATIQFLNEQTAVIPAEEYEQ